MQYIEATLDNGNFVSNIEKEGDQFVIEDNEADVIYLKGNETATIRIFEQLELDSINDLISFGTKANIFFARDCEPNAIFNTFPEEDFKTELKLEEIHLSDIDQHEDFVFAKAKGKEKEITIDALFNLFEKFSD